MKKFIGLDLSGTGTTAFYNGRKTSSFYSKDWKEHFDWIKSKVSLDSFVLFEQMHKRENNNEANKDMIDLAKLIGALEITYSNNFGVTSFMIKNFKSKIKSKALKKQEFKDIKFEKGIWYFKNRIVTEHEIDSIIIYYYGRAKVNPKFIF